MTRDEYVNKLLNLCENMGFTTELYDYNIIKIKTKLEKWMVVVKENNGLYVNSVLYHYNYFKKTTRHPFFQFPDYHVQYKRTISPDKLLKYICAHEDKWKMPLFTSLETMKMDESHSQKLSVYN